MSPPSSGGGPFAASAELSRHVAAPVAIRTAGPPGSPSNSSTTSSGRPPERARGTEAAHPLVVVRAFSGVGLDTAPRERVGALEVRAAAAATAQPCAVTLLRPLHGSARRFAVLTVAARTSDGDDEIAVDSPS
ncbi:hypothetical protein ACI2L1_38300 [Streptomyces sp. NPDC019531]|uniref:hypothetical protein n=1 Tax=Streptomyces sp. NPDC019531 TaxID=3365062 RepID=UPI00384C3935